MWLCCNIRGYSNTKTVLILFLWWYSSGRRYLEKCGRPSCSIETVTEPPTRSDHVTSLLSVASGAQALCTELSGYFKKSRVIPGKGYDSVKCGYLSFSKWIASKIDPILNTQVVFGFENIVEFAKFNLISPKPSQLPLPGNDHSLPFWCDAPVIVVAHCTCVIRLK